MFRMMKLNPPHGWRAVAWELGIVTLGVLIALGAQQWADERTWRAKVETSKAAIRDELSEHYSYAVEFRTVYPCMQISACAASRSGTFQRGDDEPAASLRRAKR